MSKSNSKSTFILSFIAFCILFALAAVLCLRLSFKYINIPTSANTVTTVIIDAGHGGEDGGTTGTNGILEKELNLIIAKKLYDYLCNLGVSAVMTRTDDTLLYDKNSDYIGHKKLLDAKERLRIASSYTAPIFISIHQNSFTESKYSGAQIYYSPNSPDSQRLAIHIEHAIRASLQPENNRKSKPTGGRIYILDRLECTAVLVECGFLSNPAECELLCSEEYQNKLCTILAEAVTDFIKNNSQFSVGT